MAMQGLDSSWELGPICQGGNQHTVIMPLVVQQGVLELLLVELGRMVWGV